MKWNLCSSVLTFLIPLFFIQFAFALEFEKAFPPQLEKSLEDPILQRTASIRFIHLNEEGEEDQFFIGMGVLVGSKWILTTAHGLEHFSRGWVFINGKKEIIKNLNFFGGSPFAKGNQDLTLIEIERDLEVNLPLILVPLKSPLGPYYVSGYNSVEFDERSYDDKKENDIQKRIGTVTQLFTRIGDNSLSSMEGCEGLVMSTPGAEQLSESSFSNCSLEHGDSGGGLFDQNGNLVAISARIATFSVFDKEADQSSQDTYDFKISTWVPLDSKSISWIQSIQRAGVPLE